jgi:hypothetical protein
MMGRLSLDEIEVVELEVDPTLGLGVDAPVGSLGIRNNGDGLYYKSGENNTAWIVLRNINFNVYDGLTRVDKNVTIYTKTINSIASGQVVVNPTSDGTPVGTPLFSSILSYSCMPVFLPGNIYQAPFFTLNAIPVDLRAVTFSGFRGTQTGVLIGGTVNSIERAPAGVVTKVTLIGIS